MDLRSAQFESSFGRTVLKLRELDITGFIQLIVYALLAVPKT